MSFVVSKVSESRLHLRLRQVKNCAICGAEGATQKNGVYSCEGCAEFYEKTIKKHKRYSCRYQENCIVRNNLPYQKICKCCRYKKCRSEGMKMPSNCLYVPTNVVSSYGPPQPVVSSYRPVAAVTTAVATTSAYKPSAATTSASVHRPSMAKTAASSSAVSVPTSAYSSTPSTSSPDIIFIPTAPSAATQNRIRKDFIFSMLILENCVFVAQICPAFVLPHLRQDASAQMVDLAASNFIDMLKPSEHVYPVTERFYSMFIEASLRQPSDDINDIQLIRMLLEQYIYASAEIIKTQIKSEVEFAVLSQMTVIKIAGEHGLTTDTELTHFVNDCSESYRAFCRKTGETFTDTKFWNLITATNKIHQYRQSTRKQVQQILTIEIPPKDLELP